MKNKKGLGGLGITLIVVGVILLLMVFYVIGAYNRFVSLSQGIDAKWSEVGNQYQRQADLIPNLIDVVKSSVNVETNFVKDVIAARTSWASASTQLAKDAAGQQMNNGISAFVSAVAENYPTLQANKQYMALTDELSGTQNRITVARGRYIEDIKSFNIAIKRFPANILAGMFGFTQKEYYQASEGSMTTPKLGDGVLP
ncbi:MAG: LemA family protein [Nanoarchaeota archaeon]